MGFVYFDLKVANESKGRLVFELFTNEAPNSTGEFSLMCERGLFKGVKFTKLIKNFMILSNTSISTTITGQENLCAIESPFLLCLSNSDPLSFFITCESSPHLNNKHTVLGKVKHGKSIVRFLERLPVISNKQSEENAWVPCQTIEISACGTWTHDDPLPNTIACTDQINGDIFEEWPDDNDTIPNVDFNSPESSFKVIEIIKSAGTTLLKEKRLSDALLKYLKAVRYCNELLPDNHNNKQWHDKFLDMKKTLFLNITLVALNSSQFKLCIEYCQFILDMDGVELTSSQVSKVFYRLSKAQMGSKLPNEALETLQKAHMILPDDEIITKELVAAQDIAQRAKDEEKAKYAKFFS